MRQSHVTFWRCSGAGLPVCGVVCVARCPVENRVVIAHSGTASAGFFRLKIRRPHSGSCPAAYYLCELRGVLKTHCGFYVEQSFSPLQL